MNKDTFCILLVTSVQSFIGKEEYPDASIHLFYDDDDYSQGYDQIKEVFRVATKDDTFQPYLSGHDCRSSIIRAGDVGQFFMFLKSDINKNLQLLNQLN